MFKTLQSRLLASYFAIICVILSALVAGIFYQTATQSRRGVQIGGELSLISKGMVGYVQNTLESSRSTDEFKRRLREIGDQSDVRILWVEGLSGEVLHDSASDWEGIKIDRDLVQASYDSVVRRTDQGGKNWLLHTPSTALTSDTFLILAKEDPPALKYFTEVFAEPLLRSGIVAGVLALILSIGIARSVAQPLQRMAQAANAVADGDYDQDLALEGPTEVQTVAHNFNHMAEQVKSSRQMQRDFVANVSHDLKTPITSIQGWSQALVDGTIEDAAMQKHSAEIIHTEAERMHRMVSQLLDLARLESGQLQLTKKPIELVMILRSIKDNLALTAKSQQISLSLEAHANPTVYADADRLMQVFNNLIANALAHTQPGDSVRLLLSAESDQAIIQVKDTGAGIGKMDIGRIFERFYQVDKSRTRTIGKEGTGLGLAITCELVQAHGGSITVDSELGEGTTFTVTLPL